MKNVRIKIPDAETALKIYLSYPAEIGNAQIRELFGNISGSYLAKIKKEVKDKMLKDGTKVWDKHNIDTKTAYEVWNLDIDDLERSYKQARRLKLVLVQE